MGNLSLGNAGTGDLNVTWSPATGDVDHYEVCLSRVCIFLTAITRAVLNIYTVFLRYNQSETNIMMPFVFFFYIYLRLANITAAYSM